MMSFTVVVRSYDAKLIECKWMFDDYDERVVRVSGGLTGGLVDGLWRFSIALYSLTNDGPLCCQGTLL